MLIKIDGRQDSIHQVHQNLLYAHGEMVQNPSTYSTKEIIKFTKFLLTFLRQNEDDLIEFQEKQD